MFYCDTNVHVYDCIPGVVFMCRVKIHKIITCSLGVSECQMFNLRNITTGVMYIKF